MPHSTALPPGSVQAHINYTARPPNGEQHPVSYYMTAGSRRTKYDRQPVTIHDIRESDETFKIDVHGFQLTNYKSEEVAFEDDEHVKSIVQPEVTELLKKLTGCTYVHHFGHIIRRDPYQKAIDLIKSDTPDDEIVKMQHPAMMAHVDQSYDGGYHILNAICEADENKHLLEKAKHGWGIISVWKPIKAIRREPLAVCDARTVSDQDLIPVTSRLSKDLHPKGKDQDFEIWQIAHNPEHQWYWASYMDTDEALLIKCFDSKKDGTARRAPHSAFNLPNEEGLPPRESIEIRTMVFWEDQDRE